MNAPPARHAALVDATPITLAPRRRVLVLCPSAWDHEMLARDSVRRDRELLFDGEDLVEQPSFLRGMTFDVFDYLERTVAKWRRERLDGVVGTGDYPGCILAAAVAHRLGLRGPHPRDIVLFSHKYYSRQIQRTLVPHATPAFASIDPAHPKRTGHGLDYPFFVKPVKGTMSIRARKVRDRSELPGAVALSMRDRLRAHLLLRPYQQLLHAYSDGSVPVHHFIGEELLEGHQVTVDGFVERGRPVIQGIVDSVMYPGTISFQRFDLPSVLPAGVQARMTEIAATLMAGTGFDDSCFNIEMFYDAARDRISVIEVNPRMSYQFADLYEHVAGTNTYEVQLALATGEPSRWRPGGGRHRFATSFVMRRFTDARVVSVPGPDALTEVEARYPGTVVKLLCAPGERLSDHDQDVGSFRYCIVNMGAPTREEIHRRYADVERILRFVFA
ncbi:ATP-grasp domain-containing protein [Myxococcota bacterium]|nr:ATP-grasp domain-containing protein [Myxococcota bacterium]